MASKRDIIHLRLQGLFLCRPSGRGDGLHRRPHHHHLPHQPRRRVPRLLRPDQGRHADHLQRPDADEKVLPIAKEVIHSATRMTSKLFINW